MGLRVTLSSRKLSAARVGEIEITTKKADGAVGVCDVKTRLRREMTAERYTK